MLKTFESSSAAERLGVRISSECGLDWRCLDGVVVECLLSPA